LVTDVVDKGIGLISESIKIIVIVASIIGGIILLFAGILILKRSSKMINLIELNILTTLRLK